MLHHRALHHGPHLAHRAINTKLLELSLHQIINYIARYLIILSLPYYLYVELSYSVEQVLLFFAWWQALFCIAVPFVTLIIKHIGIKHSIALRSWGSMIFWLGLPLALQGNFWQDLLLVTPFFALRAVCHGTAEVAYDVFLAHNTKSSNGGRIVALLRILIIASSVISPILGALIVYYFGLQAVGIVAAVIFAVSGVVLLCTPDEKVDVPYKPTEFLQAFYHTLPRDLLLAEIGYAIPTALLWVLWPIFLSFIVGDILSMSSIVAASALLSAVCAWYIGKKMDTTTKQPNLKKRAVFNSFLNIIRSVWHEPIALTCIDTCYRANQQTILVQHDRELYNWLRKEETLARSQMRWLTFEACFAVVLFGLAVVFFALQVLPIKYIFVPVFALGALFAILIAHISTLERA